MLFICRIESGSSGTAPRTRPGRNPTTGKQYFPRSGNQPGTAAEEAAGGRTRPAQEKKPGFWNGYVILEILTVLWAVIPLFQKYKGITDT